ncbi:MAG: hypothetical protein WA871_00505 [Candidatus Acidiferrales bacterium]
MDRKYKQHGYMSEDKPKKQDKKPPHDGRPRQEQFGPRTPRMVGTVSRMRCSNCGAVLQPNADPNAKCPRCAFELHSCKQCRYFDSAARFECMQPVIDQIARKDVKNDCTFYEFRTTIEKDTAPAAAQASPSTSTLSPSRPKDARSAFEDLFKK